MNLRFLSYTFFLTFLLTLSIMPVLHAAEDDTHSIQILDVNEKEKGDGYVPTSLENLSKLYWALGKLDLEDDEAIDFFLRINECELFEQYYLDDFEWERIRNATRDHIVESIATFPTMFETLTEIELDRYDIEKEEFELADNSKVSGLRRLDLTMNSEAMRRTCGHKGEIPGYPHNIVIVLNRPLVLEKIPVQRELAEIYIDEQRSQYEGMSINTLVREYKRRAYLRLRLRLTQYKETIRIVNGLPRAVIFGRLDGYEVYADIDMQKPLYFKTLKQDRFRRASNAPGGSEESDDGEVVRGPKKPAKKTSLEEILNK